MKRRVTLWGSPLNKNAGVLNIIVRSKGFKASRAIRKVQFTQKLVAYKILLFETTSLKLPNLLKMVSQLLLTVLANFSRPVRNVTLNVITVRYLLILL
jgi:hypothetical protein